MIPRRASEALVPTQRPARYLRQLGKHFAHEAATRPGRVRVEYDDEGGLADFGWLGTCAMHVRPEGLELRVVAGDPVRLWLVQRVMASHLERFGRRDGLVVHWNPVRTTS